MKPPPFDYVAPKTVDEALAVLAEHGDEAKVLAGGQSLVPLLNFRLARPSLVVDVNRLHELDYVDGGRIGALTRMRHVEREAHRLLRLAAAHVAHPQIRNRGTIGGSVAHADPAAEIPAALLALDARVRLRSARGERELPVGEFVLGAFATALEPDELLVEIVVPEQPAGARFGFAEFARVHGDFAVAGVAAAGTRLAFLGVADRPVLAAAVEELGLSGWKRSLVETLVERALA